MNLPDPSGPTTEASKLSKQQVRLLREAGVTHLSQARLVLLSGPSRLSVRGIGRKAKIAIAEAIGGPAELALAAWLRRPHGEPPRYTE